MRASKLLLEITAYYLVIGFAVYIALKVWPELRNYLPIGGVEQLISQPSKNPLRGEPGGARCARRQFRTERVLAGGCDHRRDPRLAAGQLDVHGRARWRRI